MTLNTFIQQYGLTVAFTGQVYSTYNMFLLQVVIIIAIVIITISNLNFELVENGHILGKNCLLCSFDGIYLWQRHFCLYAYTHAQTTEEKKGEQSTNKWNKRKNTSKLYLSYKPCDVNTFVYHYYQYNYYYYCYYWHLNDGGDDDDCDCTISSAIIIATAVSCAPLLLRTAWLCSFSFLITTHSIGLLLVVVYICSTPTKLQSPHDKQPFRIKCCQKKRYVLKYLAGRLAGSYN